MCDCTGPGNCKTFGRRMTERLWQICSDRCLPIPCPNRAQYIATWRAQAAALAARGEVPARGLGDRIARGLHATGLATIYHAVRGQAEHTGAKPCGGCQGRQERLNG